MLSFLQNQLGRRSSVREPDVVRSGSTQSSVSRTDSATNLSNTNSEAPSLTPATSNTDAASFSTEATPKQVPPGRSSERLRHVRSSIGSYNENVLAGSTKRRARRQTVDGATRTISGETLVEGSSNSAQEQLLQESEQALNRDWTLGAMPGDDLKLPLKEEPSVKRRRSTRLDILDKAAEMMDKTSSVLGKRGRETVDAGMERLKSLKGSKSSSLRPREPEVPSFEGPMAKRARFSDAVCKKESTPPPKTERKLMKKPTKRWLSQGLYVGQDKDFDPRLTEAKNKLKKAAKKENNEAQRSILPSPMFAGKRAIENGRDFRLPFDIFCPLPPGQPKPEEWKKTHKNVFVGDAITYWRKAKNLESSKCICTPESGCDENCFNRFMLYECDSSNCNIGPEHCTNRAFEQLRQRTKAGGKYNIGVEVCKTLDRGHGVRANRTFEPNQIIVEYTGEIITQEECDDRMHNLYKDAECYYLMDFDQQMILDATRGSIARFINHSCEPNCRMIKWTVGGKPRMALFAGDKGIMTGEELTYDYNFDPYSVKNVQECRCGSANCRGVLGPKPKEIKDALKPITTGGGQKRKLKEVVEDAVQNVKKRKLAVPKSITSAIAKAKATTSEGITKAKALTGSAARNERLVKKVSERSLRGVRRSAVVEKQMNNRKVVKKKTLITYQGRRRSSNGTFIKAGFENGEADAETEGQEKESRDIGKKDALKDKASSVRKNVVRTVRRSSRAGTGKTIRVIGHEQQEEVDG